MTKSAETNADDLAIRGLTPSQERALPLLASGMVPRQVAIEVGVSWGTIRNWCSQNDKFKGELARLRRDSHQHAVAAIHALSADATASLRTILHDTNVSARDKINAASTVLRYVMPTRSNHVLTTPDDAAAAIAEILNNLENDDGQDYL